MRSPRALLAAALAAVLLASPLAAAAVPRATGAPGAGAGPALSAEEFRSRGIGAARTLASLAPTAPAQSISGTLTLPGPYRDDAMILAAAMIEEPGMGWYPVEAALVDTDGAYTIGLWDPGTYRVAFWDYAGVYAEQYYPAASTPESGTDVGVAPGAEVTGIDATLTANPVVVIEGRVGFAGAPASSDVEVLAFSYDADWDEWAPACFATVRDGGAYRVHLPVTGAYRLGFFDWSGAFSDIYYHDASAVELAQDVAVLTTGTPVVGIDQTMTAMPSARFAGTDRYETAVEVSRRASPEGGVGSVVLTTGENWPDALVAGPYAALMPSPLLLTRGDALPEPVVEELARLAPYEVVIVGGYDAVGLEVEIALRTLCGVPVVRRLMGHDRYETAVVVAEEMTSPWYYLPGDSDVPTATVVSGEAFPDAIVAGPVAYAMGSPILLTRAESLPAATAGYLDRRGVSCAVVIGGEAAVSDEVLAQLPDPMRLGGSDRYETAAIATEWGVGEDLLQSGIFGLASGETCADAACAGAYLSSFGRGLLLTPADRLAPSTEGFLLGRQGSIARLEVFGGTASVSDDVYEQALVAAGL